jgi:neutral ceramidase
LKAGVVRCDITPAPGTPQGGWGAATHQRGLDADMPLYATALALEKAGKSVAIVDIDLIGFETDWSNKIMDAVVGLTGFARENTRLSWTHTHSGPNTFRLKTITEGLDMVLSYMEGLPLRIASAVWKAQQNLKPVRVSAGSGRCEINVNRRLKMRDGAVVVGRNWDGPADSTVRVVRIDDLDETPVATIVHYACHPTTMAWQCQYFTPDYPGMARQTVERELGGLCLFLQGATGNLTPRRGFTGDVRVYRHLGFLLGLEAAKVAATIETLPRQEHFQGVLQSGAPIALYEDRPKEPEPADLRVIWHMLKLPLKPTRSPAELDAEAEAARKELERQRREGDEGEIRAATSRATQLGWRAEYARLYHGKTHVDWPLQGIRIGPVALLAIAGEPFTEINQEIVSRSPFAHTLFSGYSHGGFGYIPARNAYPEGGYEVEASPFSAEAHDIIVKESLAMLEELAKN